MRGVGAGGRAVVVLTLLAVVQGTAGCASPAPAPPAGDPPAVVAAQVGRIVDAVAATPADQLATRFDGAELEVRQAALAVRAQVPTAPEPAPLGGDVLLTAAPAAGEWPRWFLTAVQPGGGAVPQVAVLQQSGPREPYRVLASASVLPGAALPQPARDGESAVALPGEATGLITTPAEAVSGYADVLTRGTDAPASAATASDPFREQVAAEQSAERDGVSEYVEYTAAHAPREGALWSLRTADGGALVVGVLSGQRSFVPRGVGVRQSLPADLAALAGATSAPKGLDIATAEVVVLQVPPAGGGQVQLLAGQRGTTGVALR